MLIHKTNENRTKYTDPTIKTKIKKLSQTNIFEILTFTDKNFVLSGTGRHTVIGAKNDSQ
jgi:hypothetical protein